MTGWWGAPSKRLDDGAGEHARKRVHIRLGIFNQRRLRPSAGDARSALLKEFADRLVEFKFLENERAFVQDKIRRVPRSADAFLNWFNDLEAHGPGQHDPLFDWLETSATLDQMRWFLSQEAAGEAGFDDLVALTQVKMPVGPKLEMARNYWDEMGRGDERGMHGPMLDHLVGALELGIADDAIVWPSLALANLMAGLASNRQYAYQAVGALGVIELTAPGRAVKVNAALKRLGVAPGARRYFALHATLDVQHARSWNEHVIGALVNGNPALARPIAEGALMRLVAGARCFARYRACFAESAACFAESAAS